MTDGPQSPFLPCTRADSEARVGDFSLALTVKPQLPQTLTLLT